VQQLEEGRFLGVVRELFRQEGIIVSEAAYYEQAYQGWHCHEHHHISLLIKGGNREQRSGAEQEVGAGQLLFYNSGERHKNSHTQHPSKNINVEITADFLSKYELQFSASERYPEQRANMKNVLLKIYRECIYGDAIAAATIPSLLLPCFEPPLANKRSMPPWILQLKTLLLDRWDETPALEELSLILGVHPVTISRYFPLYFNCSLGEYMRKIKIEKAIQMIQTRQMPLTAIAHACGFFDQSHFTRTFKQVTGFLPKQFQQLSAG